MSLLRSPGAAAAWSCPERAVPLERPANTVRGGGGSDSVVLVVTDVFGFAGSYQCSSTDFGVREAQGVGRPGCCWAHSIQTEAAGAVVMQCLPALLQPHRGVTPTEVQLHLLQHRCHAARVAANCWVPKGVSDADCAVHVSPGHLCHLPPANRDTRSSHQAQAQQSISQTHPLGGSQQHSLMSQACFTGAW